jgi:ABC-2 type transport system ATP-binding protein
VDAAIRIEGLTKRYGSLTAVEDVSFEVAAGEAFGYVGPNGAGKTTTIRCLLGLITPTAGSLRLHGHDVGASLDEALADVGYVPGEFSLWPQLTGRECLAFLGSLHPRPARRTAELCERLELSGADLDREVRRYSRGMKQKIGIVQAFQHEPPVVILDEPTEGLDPLMKERFVELLAEHRRGGGTVFLSSHILSEVERNTDRVGVLREGRLVRVGPTADLTGERVRHCSVAFKAPPPDGTLDLPGVSDVRGDGTAFRFAYRGDMEPLLRRLAERGASELLAEPESLTVSFFEVYEEGRR